MTIPTQGTVPAQAPLSEPVDVYQLDPETEAAAGEWPLVADSPDHDEPETDPETGRGTIAIRCAKCRHMVGFQRGYFFTWATLRPRVIEHLVRAHGYPVNATRVDT